SLHQANLNPTRYGRLPVPLPPKAKQATILEYIADRCGLLDDAMVRTQREIDLIREYRTRLISDVVTGKVDVRHLAPPPGSEDLEETVESLEPLEEDIADVVIDDEERVNGPD
ncbi:MAG: restriction endonuclease subunit S, partial [Anaerolineales bacterium]